MTFIDTHCHFYADEFVSDFEELVKKAKNANIGQILLPNIDEASAERMHEICLAHPNFLIPMMGIHPCYVKKDWQKQVEWVKTQFLIFPFYCAVGEIGIDLYWDKSLQEEQTKAFIAQVELAKAFNKPIVIHARNSFDEIFAVLDKMDTKNLSGVFHCFTGNTKQAEKALSYGNFYLGIGGVVTYKNSDLPEILQNIDLQHLLLETDAPYLPPVPHRGKRNESSYLPLIAEKICSIKNCSLLELAKITSANAQELFKLSYL